MKKYGLLVIVALIAVALAAYGYAQWAAKKAPENVYVATEQQPTVTGTTENTTESIATGETAEDGSYNVIPQTVLGWKATKPNGFHTGTIDITDGLLVVKDGKITAWQFAFDMLSITLMDIQNDKLLNEIKNDFFDANKYPVTRFTLKSVTQKGNTMFMEGDLTIKDKTNPVSFPVDLVMGKDTIKGKAQFAIDRLSRGLDMRKGMVNDYLEFSFDITWQKAAQ